jgi:hypothetical protein
MLVTSDSFYLCHYKLICPDNAISPRASIIFDTDDEPRAEDLGLDHIGAQVTEMREFPRIIPRHSCYSLSL